MMFRLCRWLVVELWVVAGAAGLACAVEDLDWRGEHTAGVRFPQEYWVAEFEPQSTWRPIHFPVVARRTHPAQPDSTWWSAGVDPMLYESADYAHGILLHMLRSLADSTSRKIELGDEAYIVSSSGVGSREHAADHYISRRITVRIGRLWTNVDINANRIRGRGSAAGRIIAEVPTEAEVLAVAAQWVAAMKRWASDRGLDLYESRRGVSRGRPTPGSGGGLAPTGVPIEKTPPGATPDFLDDVVGVRTPLASLSVGVAVAGGLTALATGVMMFGLGVTPREVFDGVRELLGGGATTGGMKETDDALRVQRAVAARIQREGWKDVTSQEQHLLRDSPEWLRAAVKRGLPAERVDPYRWGWREYTTGGLMVGKFAVDPNALSAGAFGVREVVKETTGSYFAGQGGKYVMDRATDGFVATTSPAEKAILDFAGSIGGGGAGAGTTAPPVSYMANNAVY